MELKNYSIVFTPLAKAPAGTVTVELDVQAVAESVAVSLAEAELLKEGFSRSRFKKSPAISCASTEAPKPDPVAVDPGAGDDKTVVTTVVNDPVPEPAGFDPDAALKREISTLNEKLESLAPGEVLASINVSNEAYHAANGISCSRLKLFMECPAKYKAKYVDRVIPEPSSDTFALGTAVHTIALEPHLFDKTVVKMCESIKVRRGEKWENFKALHPGKLILPKANYDLCKMANNAIQAHPFAAEMLRDGMPEVSIFKRDIETGFVVKCRPDFLIDGDLIVDVKTAASAEPKKFGMDAKKLGYHVQDAMYRDISGIPEFAFLVIESKLPCVVTAPVMMDEEVRRLGYLKYRDALQRLKICIETNNWPNYTDEPVVIGLSSWEKSQLEQLELKGVA